MKELFLINMSLADQFIEFFAKLFETESWPPRWYCGRWTDLHGWIYICADLMIWAAYMIIPFFLIVLISKKKGIPFPLVFYLFGAFILLCGFTHFIDASMFWWPAYRFNALIRFITAIVSWFTIAALIKLFPQILELKTGKEFNAELVERKKAEAIVQQKSDELASTNKELEQFAYIVSHDLKAPLRAIISLTSFFETDYKDKLDKNGFEQLKLLSGRAHHMNNLIEGILEYSKLGREKEKKILVNLNAKLKQIIEFISPPKNIKIIVENTLPEVIFDSTKIEQVFQNLIENAIKYIDKPNGIIRVGSTSENNFWKFYVADNGPGIEEKYFEKIFQIFQTLSARENIESTGIGLTIVKKIIETSGGEIWLESKINEGCTFYFTIPKN